MNANGMNLDRVKDDFHVCFAMSKKAETHDAASMATAYCVYKQPQQRFLDKDTLLIISIISLS
jgi:hypothetical protein